jgi:hypothetical protein
MGYVFGRKIENNLEIEAYKRACDYQEAVHDTVWQSGILTSAQLTLMLAVLP